MWKMLFVLSLVLLRVDREGRCASFSEVGPNRIQLSKRDGELVHLHRVSGGGAWAEEHHSDACQSRRRSLLKPDRTQAQFYKVSDVLQPDKTP